jgi:hypothetical protein
MQRFISFSGGVESTTLALLFGASARPVFADTGFEHAAMYARLDDVEGRLREIHGPAFSVVRLRREDGETLPDYIARTKFYPGFRTRFCTRMFKIEPIDAFLESQGECELMIGLNAEEAGMREGNHGLLANVRYTYPLVDLGMTRAACLALLRRAGLAPDFPAYMERGGCVGCFFKSKREYAAMAVLSPDEFDGVARLEEEIQDRRGDFYAIRDGIPNLRAFGEAVRAQGTLFPLEEMYGRASLQTSCGVFCHR